MNSYKLNNIIRKECVKDKKRFGEAKKMDFSFAYLRDLFDKYYVSEWTTFDYCCKGEDYNCWIDVESSWIRHGEKNDIKYNNRIYHAIKCEMNRRFNKKRIGRRRIYVQENEKVICVSIPMRDVAKHDHYLIFDKNHPLSCLEIC